MAGSINLGTLGDPTTGIATFSLNYNDQNQAIAFNGINNSPNAVQSKVIGWAADGTEDPNKTFALLIPPGGADSVAIPVTGAKSFPVVANSRGKIVGFNTYNG